MAMATCRECKKDVSTNAKTCPHCGTKDPTPEDKELRVTLPAAPLDRSAARAAITVRCGAQALADVDVLALFPNKTWRHATTDGHGEAVVGLHTDYLPMTVFAAAPGFAARIERDWVPADGPLAVALEPLAAGGSVIFPEGSGDIPGLSGRLNPILDTSDRTYLYASNISISEGRQQPVPFFFGESLRLTDSDGEEFAVRVTGIVGKSALLEYCRIDNATGAAR